MDNTSLVPIEHVEKSILLLRGKKVILDEALSSFYGVTTKRLNEQVKRNAERFPPDFVFQLSDDEHRCLRSQSATLETGRGRHRKFRPWAFTEHGALMAASVLSSPKAIEMSLHIVRAFVKLREMVSTHGQLAEKLAELERAVSEQDERITVLFNAVRELMAPPPRPRKRIGFRVR